MTTTRPPSATSLPPGATTGAGASGCFNQSNPTQPVPCPTVPEESFIDKHLWKLICAVVCLLLAITCAVLSYWRYSKKAEVIKEREEKKKKHMQEKFAKEIAERRREKELQAERDRIAAAEVAEMNEL